ncbi:MAG: hypothetical protein KAT70_01555, partial [Thermoplasmata archaeon]|nr:hypothetical protein [Thermoplasmata archaeon]
MWLLSLKMALRPNKRSILAMMGVAVCLMYVSGTTALVDGLKEGKERFMEERTEQYYICSKDDSLSSLFTPEEVEIIGNEGVVWGVVTPVIIFDMDTFLLGFDDASNMMCSCPLVENSTGVLLGPLLPEEEGNSTNLSTSSGERTIMIEGRLDNLTSQGTMFFPPDWIVSTPEHVRDCGGQSAGVFSFFITTDIASLDTAGLVVQPLISKDAFFVESMGQVESALWLLTTMAGMITLVVIYNLMHVEIMARSKDIR